MRDELLGLRHEPPLVEEPGAHTGLDTLDQDPVLGADLGVERKGLLDPRVVGVGCDEVVEKAVRALGSERDDGTDREVGSARHHVDHRAGKEQVELAPLDLARGVVRPTRFRAGRAELRHAQGSGLEQIRIGRDVHDRGETGMRDRAVVALEEVLGADLPVRLVLGLGARQEAKGVEVDACGRDSLGDVVEHRPERRCVEVRVHEDERSPRFELEANEPELQRIEPSFAVRPGCLQQATVEAVRPRVVGALDRLALPRALAHDRSPVPAHVQERTELALAVADE